MVRVNSVPSTVEPVSLSLMERFGQMKKQYWSDIEAEMKNTVRRFTPKGSSLVEMFEDVLDSGGKRLRAILPLVVAEALGQKPEKMIPFAAACEMLHNATLVHDDLQDGDEVRRGKPTIWKKYGEKHAIDLGDAMMYYAVLLLQRLDTTFEVREKITERFVQKTLEVIDGQEREFLLSEKENPIVKEYIRMVEGKTSALFELPMTGALELCTPSGGLSSQLGEAVRQLGVLFQIQDDVLDLYADKGRKEQGSDIREGKRSLLAVYAIERSSPERALWLQNILNKERAATTEEEVKEVTEYFRQCGAYNFALQEIDHRHQLALRAAREANDPAIYHLISELSKLFTKPIHHLLQNATPKRENTRPHKRHEKLTVSPFTPSRKLLNAPQQMSDIIMK